MNQIKVKKLKISLKDEVLVDISFDINSSLAIIGESGSGKSLTIKSILNLLPQTLKSEIDIESDFSLEKSQIGFVPQNPFTSLSPMTLINKQFFCDENKKEEVLNMVGLDKEVLKRYPMQLSGGQLQRVTIAISLSNNPKLLLLDEPTTALDKKSKDEIIELITKIKELLNLKIIFVTHDISIIKSFCEELIILQKGKIVEKGLTIDILENPEKEYTKKLIASTFQNREFRV